MIRLYVDDLRRCPDGWKIARTITEAIHALHHGLVDEISIDHDICFLRGTDIRMHKESFMPVVLYLAVMPKDRRPAKVQRSVPGVWALPFGVVEEGDVPWFVSPVLRQFGKLPL